MINDIFEVVSHSEIELTTEVLIVDTDRGFTWCLPRTRRDKIGCYYNSIDACAASMDRGLIAIANNDRVTFSELTQRASDKWTDQLIAHASPRHNVRREAVRIFVVDAPKLKHDRHRQAKRRWTD